MPVVIDNSVILAWCMGDKEDITANDTMLRVVTEGGVVPRI